MCASFDNALKGKAGPDRGRPEVAAFADAPAEMSHSRGRAHRGAEVVAASTSVIARAKGTGLSSDCSRSSSNHLAVLAPSLVQIERSLRDSQTCWPPQRGMGAHLRGGRLRRAECRSTMAGGGVQGVRSGSRGRSRLIGEIPAVRNLPRHRHVQRQGINEHRSCVKTSETIRLVERNQES